MQELPRGVRPGLVVRARGEVWMVVSATAHADCALVTLAGHEASNCGRRTRLIAPFDELLAEGASVPRRQHRVRLGSAVLAAAARSTASDGLWTVDGGFDVLPWQLAPALSVVGGATRLLLADAVGLGKTIQAGLLLAETLARGWVERALILTPAGLREPWADELVSRFGLNVSVLDHDRVRRLSANLPAAANAWSTTPIVVSSIDLVKRPDVRAAVEQRPLDLLIVDEAHHVTPGTDRGSVVERLARRTPWLVLASATPHTGDRRAFRFLLGLGRVGAREPRMTIFRRTRRDVGLDARRRTTVLRIAPTPDEERLHASIRRYATAMHRGPHASHQGIHLVSQVVARRATSSAIAVERTLARRLALVSGTTMPMEPRQDRLPWDEADEDADLHDEWLGVSGLGDRDGECAWLRELVALARVAARRPSKLASLARLLRRTDEPVIVFSEFRDTLDACLPWVAPFASVALLHGGMDVAARHHAVADFTSGRARLLLATDVAGEGLNLQARCRLAVTLEWPWSPQRIEQRTGRVDRIGQLRRVHVILLTGRGTFEDRVVAHLLQRAARARQDFRDQVPGLGRAVEAGVFSDEADGPSELSHAEDRGDTKDTRPPRRAHAAVDPAARSEAARLEGRRRLLQQFESTPAIAGWAYPSRRVGATKVAVIFEVTAVGPTGRVDARSVTAVEVTLARTVVSRREWRWLCRALAGCQPVLSAVLGAAPLVSVPPDIVQRLDALLELASRCEAPRVQPSLFDRRAVRAAAIGREANRRLAEHLRHKARAFARDASGTTVVPRLLAVLPFA